jgi:hypothetical protein
MPTVPFYLDWQFWSAVVAALALVLSQLPPVYVLLRRTRLRCETFSRMHLTHHVGNPSAQWHLIIENTGGRAVRVKAISLIFSKTGGILFELPAQNYLRTPDAAENVLLTPFRLSPGDEWAHIVNFFPLFSRDDDKEYRLLASAIRSDILAQKEDPANKEKLCEAQPEVVQSLMTFFERQFKWEPGEYEAELKVITDLPTANLSQRFRFSLFESESNELRGYTDGYRHGAGVYWVSPAQPGIIVPVHEK